MKQWFYAVRFCPSPCLSPSCSSIARDRASTISSSLSGSLFCNSFGQNAPLFSLLQRVCSFLNSYKLWRTVVPPLNGIGNREYIAGEVPNTAANLMRWIQHPHQIEPHTVMREMNVTEQDSRDIAAYLYTLRGAD